MNIIDRIIASFSWEFHHNSGKYSYYQNTHTGQRKVGYFTLMGGHQPIDQHWLDTGERKPRPLPPKGLSAIKIPVNLSTEDKKDILVTALTELIVNHYTKLKMDLDHSDSEIALHSAFSRYQGLIDLKTVLEIVSNMQDQDGQIDAAVLTERLKFMVAS